MDVLLYFFVVVRRVVGATGDPGIPDDPGIPSIRRGKKKKKLVKFRQGLKENTRVYEMKV